MILEEFDPSKEAVINPDMVVEKIENFPEIAISCFSVQLFEKILTFFDPKEIGAAHTANGSKPIYEVVYKGRRFAFFKSYVGEPACVGEYEDIIAMGSKCLILLGNCGVLDRRIEDCEIIIPIKAIRDEGCSYHYAPAGDNLDHSDWEPRSLSGNARLDDKSKIALLAFELGVRIQGEKDAKVSMGF